MSTGIILTQVPLLHWDILCLCIRGFICGICIVIICPSSLPLFVFRDCGTSWISIYIFRQCDWLKMLIVRKSKWAVWSGPLLPTYKCSVFSRCFAQREKIDLTNNKIIRFNCVLNFFNLFYGILRFARNNKNCIMKVTRLLWGKLSVWGAPFIYNINSLQQGPSHAKTCLRAYALRICFFTWHDPYYRILPNYRTYPYKRTVKPVHSLQITASVLCLTSL